MSLLGPRERSINTLEGEQVEAEHSFLDEVEMHSRGHVDENQLTEEERVQLFRTSKGPRLSMLRLFKGAFCWELYWEPSQCSLSANVLIQP